MKTTEVLRKAASVMKKRGHARYCLEDTNGAVCLMGAINVALYGDPTKWTRKSDAVLRRVATYLCRKQKVATGSISAISWNNYEAKDGTEVIAALRGAARS